MSTTKEQMQDIDNQRLNKIILFLRVCYRHKCRLRSFECFPSFQELINVIIKLYPSIKSQISSSSNKDKNKNRIPKRSTNKHHDQCWRLETNESDWIENDNDWNVIIQYLKHSKLNKNVAEKSKISSNGNDKEENDTSSNHNKKESEMKHNNDPINLTLRLIIQDPGNDAYDPRKPSTMQNYTNPSSLSNERPPPPPYGSESNQAIAAQPYTSTQPHYPNPYAPTLPYYGYNNPQPAYSTQPNPYSSSPQTTVQSANSKSQSNSPKSPLNNGNGSQKRVLSEEKESSEQPPTKKRKFSEKPSSPESPKSSPVTNGSPSNSASTANSTPLAPSLNPVSPMPSGPPPNELLDANPYGIVHMNGYVWCDACNRWFEIHCFDSHLLNVKELSMDHNLWYAQICLSCLSEVHYSSWHQHVNGQVHQNNFSKTPRTVVVNRKMPPGNEGSADIPTLFAEKYFTQISNYVPGSKILVLGEQDFSYSLAVCNVLQTGDNLVGTSYLGAFDANASEPEEHPADDGIRANYFRRTLPSHQGQLQHNLNLLSQYHASTAHNIDGTKLWECLKDAKPPVYTGPFDIIVFPFPRASLKRGLDFRNSTLIQGFFHEIRARRSELLYPLSQIQMIVLDNQFKEWDIANIAKENGWTLKWRCCINFSSLPQYQPRELSGKAWNPKTARLLVFLWDTEFDKSTESALNRLNQINDLALLPDEAMKVTKQAKLLDAYHAQGIRQHQNPILTRLSAPPSSLHR